MVTAADELRFHLRKLRSLVTFRAELEALMADVDSAVAELAAAVTGVATRVQEDVDALLAQIDALENTSVEDKAALARAAAGIASQVARLSAIDPVVPEPPVEEPPVEEPPVEEPPVDEDVPPAE